MHHFTTSDGVRIAYYVDDATRPWTTPDTLLILHPAMGSAKRFFAWVPPLSPHYRVLRWDMRGHGASDVPGPDKPLTLERLVQDVLELLDHLGIAQVHIVGNSAGGYIGQNIAFQHPDRIKSLMLFSSTPGLKHSNWNEWLPQIAKTGLRHFLSEGIRDRLPVDQMDPAHVNWFLDEAESLDMEFGGRFIQLMSSSQWWERLQDIQCPTLIASPGLAAKGILSGDIFEEMRQRIPNAQLITYEGLPIHLTDAVPERCVSDVLAFLRWHFGDPGARVR